MVYLLGVVIAAGGLIAKRIFLDLMDREGLWDAARSDRDLYDFEYGVYFESYAH
ncbi:MAG: hypothetical protein OXI18_02560 [bacterium]|nr:hypothetical protein [bacterium]